MHILKCSNCAWEFKYTHTSKCPQCGCNRTTESGNDEVFNHAWIKRQEELAKERIACTAKEVQCCYTSKHTRGFHHDSNCPKHVMCY